MAVPAANRYTKDHEWIKSEGTTALIGITDYAQHELGDVVFVDLPAVGKEFTKGQTLAVVESVKAASDIYAPVSGKVTEVNSSVAGSPELINSSPFDQAWLVRIELKDAAELQQLMDAGAYDDYVAGISK